MEVIFRKPAFLFQSFIEKLGVYKEEEKNFSWYQLTYTEIFLGSARDKRSNG